MRKLFRSLCFGLALVCLLSACSKETDIADQAINNGSSEESVRKYPGQEVNLDLEFDLDLSDESSRAFFLEVDANNKNKPTTKFSVGETVRGRIYVAGRPKNSNTEAPAEMRTVEKADFTVKKVSADGRRIRFASNGRTWVKGYNETTKTSHEWYLSVILIGDTKAHDGTYLPNQEVNVPAPFPLKKEDQGNTMETLEPTNGGMLRIPYGFGWTKFEWDKMADLYRNAVFKPMGILLRFNFKNEIPAKYQDLQYLKYYRINSISFESNTLYRSAKITPLWTDDALKNGKFNWENTSGSNTWEFKPLISAGTDANHGTVLSIPNTDLAPKGSTYYYMWFANTQETNNTLKVTVKGDGTAYAKDTYTYTTTLSTVNKQGTTPTRTFKLTREYYGSSGPNERLVHPMFWLAPDLGYVGAEGQSNGLEMENEETSGYGEFDPWKVTRKVDTGGVHYHGSKNDRTNGEINRYLPTMMDWMTILPVARADKNVWAWKEDQNDYQFGRTSERYVNRTGSNVNRDWAVARTTVQRGLPYYIDAKYYYAGNNLNRFYGLRFIGKAYPDYNSNMTGVLYPAENEFRSAWRYRYDTGARKLFIDIVHIGPGEDPYLKKSNIDITDINNDAYFDAAHRAGRMVTHCLPFGGTYENGARYLTASRPDSGTSTTFMAFGPHGIHMESDHKLLRRTKVRFFIVNPFDGIEDQRAGLKANDLNGYTPTYNNLS